MKILVTGSTGFIGSSLVPELRKEGHEVWEMVRYIAGRFDYYEGQQKVFADLRDSKEVHATLLGVKPDVVIHLAAQSAVAYSFDHTEEVNDVVYMGTVRVVNACREVGAWLIQASSSEVYGRGDHIYPLTEDQRIGGTSPYAAAKVAAEEYLRVMQHTYNMPITIVRPFNTIGRALVGNHHFVVERAITQAIQQSKIILHDPRPERDFMFRTDHVGIYKAILKHRKEAEGETFNACTGFSWTIRQMANEVADEVWRLKEYGNREAIPVEFLAEPDRPLDIAKLQGSNEKAQRLLAWQPRYTIAQGINQAVLEWWEVLGKNA